MTFSNPAGDAAAAAPAYIRALLDLLGSRDPFDVLPELMPWLDARLRDAGDETLRRSEAPGKWSCIEVIQHLADSEIVYGFRGRMVLSQDRPALLGFDQDRWAVQLHYADAPRDLALRQLGGLREANLRLWRSLTPEQLQRVGMHSERGAESVDRMLRLNAAHDLVHRRQIERILSAVG
ncbi:MAG: DinB family protein [Actinomycetota bacterium]